MADKYGLIPERRLVDELDRYYGIMANKIKEDLLKLNIDNYNATRAFRTRDTIASLIKILNRYAMKWSDQTVTRTYRDIMQISKTTFAILGSVRDPFFNEQIHTGTIEDDIEGIQKFLVDANQSIKLNVDTYLYLLSKAETKFAQLQEFDMRDEEIISELLDQAIIEGQSRWKVGRLIRDHFEEIIGEEQFIYINGRNYNLRKYAKMVARTRIRKVQSDSTINSCKQYKNDLVQVSDHGTKTEICLPYEGNVYSLTGETKGYDTLPFPPPFHPNCMHHIAPTSITAIEWRKKNA